MNFDLSVIIVIALGVSAFLPTFLLLAMARRAARDEPSVLDRPFVELLESQPALAMPWPVSRRRLEMIADRSEAVFASLKVVASVCGSDGIDRHIPAIRFRFTVTQPLSSASGRYFAEEIALSLGAPSVDIEMDTQKSGWICVPVAWDELDKPCTLGQQEAFQ